MIVGIAVNIFGVVRMHTGGGVDEVVEKLLSYFTTEKISTGMNPLRFEVAYNESQTIFT